MSDSVVEKAKRQSRKLRAAASGKRVGLRLVHIDFWSAIRVGLVIQVALAIATLVGAFVLWLVLSSLGIFGSVNTLVTSVVGNNSVDVNSTLSLPTMMSFAAAISVFNLIVGTLLAGVVALVFNVIAKITGGLLVGFTNN
ncbi:MAG: hypothetical protein RL556_662 [Actinomycetota bacterium]|jgi:hypothetical protein